MSRTYTMTKLAAAVMVLVPLFAAPLTAGSQPGGKVYRIGFITTGSPKETQHLLKALDEGLRERGYVDGRNIVFERRFAEGRQERLPALAVDLVRLKVDVIVTGSNPVITAVKQATSTIPVVMAVSRDPVGSGFVASLARPGGNITGFSNDPGADIQAKNMELLKEAVPRMARVAYLWNPVPPGADAYRRVAETAARNVRATWQSVEVRQSNELEGAFAAMVRERADAVLVAQDPVFISARTQIVLLAARHRLPAIYGNREYAEAGGLMSYGPNIADQFRGAAAYIDKILKGAKPGDLAVEQPTKFELVLNLKAANALGLAIPRSLLLRADQVIE
jgi:putative ABC transport system substrate-binding protein